MKISLRTAVQISVSILPLMAINAYAQVDEPDKPYDEIIVVGTQIKGADIAGDLPVSVITAEDLVAAGLESGEDLLRSIPQVGAIGFNGENASIVGINSARGDVASYNLRSLGEGNTLVLLNGRRMVLHPITQTDFGVPVTTPNANTLPTGAIKRVEVLRDGAGAIYGADAVGGVINYVLDDDYDGAVISSRFGGELDGGRLSFNLRGAKGFQLNEGRTSVVVSASADWRDGLLAREKDYAANSDQRVNAPDAFANDLSLDNRSSLEVFSRVDFNGLGGFHLRPTDLVRDNGNLLTVDDCGGRGLDGAQTSFFDGVYNVCLDSSGQDRAIRPNRNEQRTLVSDNERYNFFGYINHELSADMELYGEASYYQSKTERQWEQASILSNGRFFVPSDYYYNPFGPVTFDDGRANPNRLPGLDPTIVPVEGLGFEVISLRPVDVGPRDITVTGDSFRLLGGIRGQFSGWDYDSALLHSGATVTDSTDNRISTPLLQASLRLDTPAAYNIFTGVNPNNPASITDFTPNPRNVIDPFIVNVTRAAETQLTLADFRVSNPSIYALPDGNIGIGLGVEFRSETFDENNSDLLDGSAPFIDPLDTSLAAGEITNQSSVQGSSFRPDISGDRQVFSAWGELLIPVLRNRPLFYQLDVQAAVRYENFSGSGDITRPKIGVAWSPIEQIKFRGAYSLGFRAPNLVQLNTPVSNLTTSVDDFAEGIFLGTGDINDGPSNGNYVLETSGNPDLQPETSENINLGVVLEPINDFTFTADFWRVETEGTTGVPSGSNASRLDALLRDQGSFNPNVIRDTPDADNPLGEIVLIRRGFENLNRRTVEGLDLGAQYRRETGFGDLNFKVNAARLLTFDQEPGELADRLVAFGADPDSLGSAAGSLIETSDFPKWRGHASVGWRGLNSDWSAFVSANYVGSVIQTFVTDADGNAYEVPSRIVVNGSITKRNLFQEGLRAQLGMQNVFDEDPPFSDSTYGYNGALHSNLGRYVYLRMTKNFD
ncbi:TonB-dependent receptor domain-containing protein [Robiginitomaculum antarcticum]|uniref:TonB-dependent receptor domain-containing protein n=1 Tax=Robiginitomaculum antarcticum TaxID=437507 RepID=UPI0003658BE4|nr:TonB-dependent receptor [Robiginitomaculum antarcticum]